MPGDRLKKLLNISIVFIISLVFMSNVTLANKVLIVGLDGANPDKFFKWVEEGKLPNIAKIYKEGSSGTLRSTTPPLTPVAMASLLTGKNPGSHGIFSFEKKATFSYETHFVNSLDIKENTLPEILSKNGKKVIMVNVPMTYPPKSVNGILISGFPGSISSNFTFPPELREKLLSTDYKMEAINYVKGKEKEFLGDILSVSDKKSKLAVQLMKENEWDLFMIFYTEDARLQHFFSDEETVLNLYKKLDKDIGELIETAGNDTKVIIFSDHGFDKVKKTFNINAWLYENDLLKIRGGIPLIDWIIELINKIFPIKQTVKSSEINWKSTEAYTSAFYSGNIVINLKGREPEGIVNTDKYESLKNSIIDKLKQVKDPDTGDLIIEKVLKKEEVYSGRHVDSAPDIIVLMKEYNMIGGSHNDALFLAPREKSIPVEDGIIMSNMKLNLKDASIIDIMPTLLKILDIKITDEVEGKALIS